MEGLPEIRFIKTGREQMLKNKIKKVLVMIIFVSIMLNISACNKNNEVILQDVDSLKSTENVEETNDSQSSEGTDAFENSQGNTRTQGNADCYVYICGQVNRPGVYALREGDRVFVAIELAGGLTQDAAVDFMNQAEVITDGMKIEIPTVEEADLLEKEIFQKEAGLVNINLATKEELMTLPGIGEGRATAIIEYRDSCGGFKTPEDLLKVDGIKQGIYEKMKALVTI